MNFPRIAVIYLSYNPRPYLDRVIKSFEKINYSKNSLELVVIDNPHPEFGSAADFLKEKLLPLSGDIIPKVTILENSVNVGFTQGNNQGIEYALKNNFDFVFLHNQDGFMGLDCLARLVSKFESDPLVAAAQPMVLLYPEIDLINSAGNCFHYLGFGYSGNYRESVGSFKMNNNEIGYCSGSAVMVKTVILKKVGGFYSLLKLYHEDLELGLRLRLFGYKNILVPSARFYHEYEFGRNQNKFYQMERNRFIVLFTYYKWLTLLLLAPVLLIMEIGLIFFALFNGWCKEKISAIGYFFNLKNWPEILKRRKEIQVKRKITFVLKIYL